LEQRNDSLGKNWSKYVEKTQEKISHSGLDNSAAKLLEKDTLLISIFATLGEVSILKIDAACNQAIAGITVDPKLISTDYLYYYLIHIKNNIKDRGRGVAQNNINLSILNNTQIVVPPLETQQKIVAILDKAEEIKRLRAVANVQTQKLIQSVFLDMFGDPLTNPCGFDTKKLWEVTEVRGRVGWRGYKRTDLRESGPIVIGATHITDYGSIDLSTPVHISQDKYLESPEIIVKKHDIIFTQRGNTIGKSGLVRADIGEATINPCVLIIRPTLINPYYLNYLFNHRVIKDKFWELNKSSAQPMITQQDIKNLSIIIPPLRTQEYFAQIVCNVQNMMTKEFHFDYNYHKLYRGILQKAFSGELTT
jgi:type I restriction enzyme S subunit